MAHNASTLTPEKFHAICRKPRSDVPWLLPSKKLSVEEAAFRDAIRIDITKVSNETLELITSCDRDSMWLKRIAEAEKLHR